jgi:hypothetical protein
MTQSEFEKLQEIVKEDPMKENRIDFNLDEEETEIFWESRFDSFSKSKTAPAYNVL